MRLVLELLLVVAVGIVGWVLARRRSGRAERTEQAQDRVEALAMRVLAAHPSFSDEQVATLVRDDLTNAKEHDPAFHVWASPETVARLRRTTARVLAEELARAASDHDLRREVPGRSGAMPVATHCPSCGTLVVAPPSDRDASGA
jgi:hypothetical protein